MKIESMTYDTFLKRYDSKSTKISRKIIVEKLFETLQRKSLGEKLEGKFYFILLPTEKPKKPYNNNNNFTVNIYIYKGNIFLDK